MSDVDIQLFLSYVVVILTSIFLISIGNRFVETISDRTVETHLGGGFIAGLYTGYGLDPDAMILREFVNLTAILSRPFLSFVLTSLTILSLIEIVLGLLYTLEKRSKSGPFGHLLVICSGYLFPMTSRVAIFVFLFGISFFVHSKESGF
jgi:hypothetical protein